MISNVRSCRMLPINRSAYGFCHGDRTAVTISSIPIPATRLRKYSPYLIAISEKESWCSVLREAFDELLCRPDSGGVCAYIEMHDPPPVMQQHNEPVQDVESHCRHCEETNAAICPA